MSYGRESANRRRDARQAKVPDVRAPSVTRRDTKKWCRGKIGVEHKPVCVAYNDLKNSSVHAPDWKILICTACGKQLAHWWPSPFRPTTEQAPDWVKKGESNAASGS